MRTTNLFLLPALITLFTAACNHETQVNPPASTGSEKNAGTGIQDTIKPVKQTTGLTDFNFEPSVSTISGTLKIELYYGPPNFGESPETDAKEYSYILYPDKPINVSPLDDSNSFNVATKGITKFQLAAMDQVSLKPFADKRIVVTGQFFGAQTGHHHTDVLMAVTKATKE